ncbi:Pol polyprotein [Elysia marginata]|uniref:Pol polyprotein n=1 Tax=Elysia marginata TaxID=1093978 RepID=A0AAV4FCF9_9GAST|nr:Pol polyprotein [Elysia marginata]
MATFTPELDSSMPTGEAPVRRHTSLPLLKQFDDLHKLADECSYLTLKDELIRDRIVVGVRDDDLSKVLQGKQDLDLSEAIRFSRQAETRTESQNLLRPRVDLVKSFARTSHNSGNKRFVPAKQLPPNTPGTKCGNCGKSPRHKKEACPARTDTCHSCNKKGHYSSVCRSSKVREVQGADEACHFLGSVHHVGEIDTTWTAVLQVDGNPVKFKLDTGAAVSVVGERFANGRSLQSCDKLLKGPGDTPLQVLGVFQAKLSYKDTEMWETLHVIQGQHQPLLSASACLQLGLIARLNSLTTETPDFRAEFLNLFKGLGRLKDEYTIKTRPDIQPVSIYTPRKIAHP